jgi:hypothetical protein
MVIVMSALMLIVIMLNVVILNAVVLSVVVPRLQLILLVTIYLFLTCVNYYKYLSLAIELSH